jgi:hypothetical protein
MTAMPRRGFAPSPSRHEEERAEAPEQEREADRLKQMGKAAAAQLKRAASTSAVVASKAGSHVASKVASKVRSSMEQMRARKSEVPRPQCSVECVLSIGGTLGLRWKPCAGDGAPHGTERANPALAVALAQDPPQLQFTRRELEAFNLYDLHASHYIRASNDQYFQPDIGTPLRALVSGQQSSTVRVRLDRTQQHTVAWAETLCLVDSDTNRLDQQTAVPPGESTLSRLPQYVQRGTGVVASLSAAQVTTLENLLAALVESTDSDWCDVPDATGARPIHSLVACDSDSALGMAWRLLQQRPSLLAQLHAADDLDGSPPCLGESCLHILCVNRREDLLLDAIALGEAQLPADAFAALLRAQACGAFFETGPMRFYGGTALAYACCFRLQRAVHRLLNTGIVGLNERDDACVLTGFLPLHAVVANALPDMYDWLTALEGTMPLHGPAAATAAAKHLARQQSPRAQMVGAAGLMRSKHRRNSGGATRDPAAAAAAAAAGGGGGRAGAGGGAGGGGAAELERHTGVPPTPASEQSALRTGDVRIWEQTPQRPRNRVSDEGGEDAGGDGDTSPAATQHKRGAGWTLPLRGMGIIRGRAADESQVVAANSRLGARLQVQQLNPLQLACWLGDHAMFKHILRKQVHVLWKCTPRTPPRLSRTVPPGQSHGSPSRHAPPPTAPRPPTLITSWATRCGHGWLLPIISSRPAPPPVSHFMPLRSLACVRGGCQRSSLLP